MPHACSHYSTCYLILPAGRAGRALLPHLPLPACLPRLPLHTHTYLALPSLSPHLLSCMQHTPATLAFAATCTPACMALPPVSLHTTAGALCGRKGTAHTCFLRFCLSATSLGRRQGWGSPASIASYA